MLKTTNISDTEKDVAVARRRYKVATKRTHSASPVDYRLKFSEHKKPGRKRCQSVSPAGEGKTMPDDHLSEPEKLSSVASKSSQNEAEKEIVLPKCVLSKMLRNLATKKREFLKLRKNFIAQQNNFLEVYAQLKEMESRIGATQEENIGEVRVLSVTTWPAHDLLMLVRDNQPIPIDMNISGVFGPQIHQQLTAQLNPIPEEVLALCAEVMARRIELLAFLRTRFRGDRSTYLTNLEWKSRNSEFDIETEKLHRLVAGSAENLKAKISYALNLAKVPWIDRENIVKRYERYQKENALLQQKLDDLTKRENEEKPQIQLPDGASTLQEVCTELEKERAAREALKNVVSSAEGMLRVARVRIVTLERHLKEAKAEVEVTKKKYKDLEQLHRQRENCYDSRSKKLIEASKTGEMTIEALSRQRDALELRVKELSEKNLRFEEQIQVRTQEQTVSIESLQAKLNEQVKAKEAAERRADELSSKVNELKERLSAIHLQTNKLLDAERKRYLAQAPKKEAEPTIKETEVWKELQVTQAALATAEEELRQSRLDKDNFLNMLSRIAQGEPTDSGDLHHKIAAELVDKERMLGKLQGTIDEQQKNIKSMEQEKVQYENKIAALKLEVNQLRAYDCYNKEMSYDEVQAELTDLRLQVATLSRERKALITAASTRALMLERHERSLDLYTCIVRARSELENLVNESSETATLNDNPSTEELTRSLSSVRTNAAETWSALRAERARVLMLETAVLTQNMQLDRESRVRTQMERHRATLERELVKARMSRSPTPEMSQNPSFVFFLILYIVITKLSRFFL